ncbi:hypothetical protein P154DRAFT_439054 [Amniculicola lignicola CBS 123094]|uniref:Zn(2)-C6 fungal-type domain-containing protein n=1 Tax=Amniculicola lignicola CBS 123094 TaxID=1392246 RepID=A0A6A5W992_9PLEO|nr:hypothetical protein P154DRAFT_439054 [Amniculicola lignicola CBS 123094]
MSTPDADDASPSPEYSGDQDGSDMAAEQKLDSVDGEASPEQANGNSHAASHAKDPTRPRRKKAKRACFACQRAHLTCSDQRPCGRCVKRGLADHCMDGVRKKAKYLHDAPDSALIPGVAGYMNGGHAHGPLGSGPSPEAVAVSVPQSAAFYTQPPSATYYAQNAGPLPSPMQEAPPVGPYSHPQPPISPPYSQTNQVPIASVPSTVAQAPQPQMSQFGGPMFDPSDPAFFNFDINGLNFNNQFAAIEMGMLTHMASGSAETPPSDNSLMNPLNQAAGVYNPQMMAGAYSEGANGQASLSFAPDGLPHSEWHPQHSRHGSLQVQTPHNTPTTQTIDHIGHRQESLSGPYAYAIGQGPGSHSSASPASIDMQTGYDNDNPLSAATFFANSAQQQAPQRSPTVSRLQQENRPPSGALQPMQYNVVRKRRRDTSWIYNDITKPYNHNAAFHRLILLVQERFSKAGYQRVKTALAKFRPVLVSHNSHIDKNDLIHTEKNLQRSVMSLEDNFAEVGTPSLICRRTGEVVGMNKEFTILTGWKREILLGEEPNLNVNRQMSREASNTNTGTGTTPIMAGQDPDTIPGPRPVSIFDLLDEDSACQWLEDFAELAYTNSRGTSHRRVNMVKYCTKETMAKMEERKAHIANGTNLKNEPPVKVEGGAHHGEAAIGMLGARDGMVDCMIIWNIRRDNFDMPMLACIQVSTYPRLCSEGSIPDQLLGYACTESWHMIRLPSCLCCILAIQV